MNYRQIQNTKFQHIYSSLKWSKYELTLSINCSITNHYYQQQQTDHSVNMNIH